jgi:hypothetical protein
MNVPWEELLTRFDQLGVAVSGSARQAIEFSWPLAMRQQEIAGWELVLLGVFILIIISLGLLAMRKEYHTESEGIFLFGLFSLFGIFFISLGAIRLLNPGWYALIALRDLVGISQ